MFFLHFFGQGQYMCQYRLPFQTRQPRRSASFRISRSSF